MNVENQVSDLDAIQTAKKIYEQSRNPVLSTKCPV